MRACGPRETGRRPGPDRRARRPSGSRRRRSGRPGPASVELGGFDALCAAVGADDDLLDPQLGRLEAVLAMGLEERALLVEGDRFLERSLSGLELGYDRLEALQGVLEAEIGGNLSGVSHRRRP